MATGALFQLPFPVLGDPMDVRAQLLAAVGKSRLSERRLSMLATGGTDAVRNIRRGSIPRLDTVERLLEALGLQLEVTPGPLRPDGELTPRQPSEFTGDRELPIYELTDPAEKGYLRSPGDPERAPAPSDLSDEQAFYLRMPDHSMVPGRIGMNDLCLVSPCEKILKNHRAWLREGTGRERVGWVMRISRDGWDLGTWDLDEVGHSNPAHIQLRREDVVERGVIVAVYRETPVATKTLEPVADWRPDPASELWRAGLFSDAVKKLALKLDKTVSSAEETERQIKLLVAQGELSAFEATQIVRVLDDRLQNSLSTMRSSLSGKHRDGSEDTPEQ